MMYTAPRMGATREDFIKYPRTPHLFGSKGTDDDKHLGQKESEAFIADPLLIVEEKLDGTNVGIHFTVSGRMVLQSDGGPLLPHRGGWPRDWPSQNGSLRVCGESEAKRALAVSE